MPAPTALLKTKDERVPAQVPLPPPDQEEELMADVTIDTAPEPTADAETEMAIDVEDTPNFPAAKDSQTLARRETRKVQISAHRMAPLKAAWPKIYAPLVENLKLQTRMNLKTKQVEIRTCKQTVDSGAIQRAEDFVRAYNMGFDVEDALAILRLDGIFVQTFEIRDVKTTLTGDHLARAIGRIAGKDGRTKFAIENVTRTRIVLADSRISILGGFKEIGMARESVVSLILGKPPGKVYGNLRTISSRMKERF